MKDYNFKLNIKAISLFEQMTDIPYTNINYESIDETTKLLYCCVVANNNIINTYEDFLILLKNEKFYKNISEKLSKEIKFNEQFIKKININYENKDKKNNVKINDIIPILVGQCGLDVSYVMFDMSLNEIEFHINNYNSVTQTNLEMSRLWTYYTILPHVDSKKLKSPKDLIKFNWEAEPKDLINDITEDDFDAMIKSAPKFDKK